MATWAFDEGYQPQTERVFRNGNYAPSRRADVHRGSETERLVEGERIALQLARKRGRSVKVTHLPAAPRVHNWSA